MEAFSCTGDQAGGRWRSFVQRLRQRISNNLERDELEIDVSILVYLRLLIKGLARCWLKHDEGRVDKHGANKGPPPEQLLNRYVRLQAYVLTAVTGLGYLALTWATVVLLGGFVSSLGKKDFWCLTVISTIQAAKIFDTLQDELVLYILRSLIWSIINWSPIVISMRSALLLTTQGPIMSVGEFFYTIIMLLFSLLSSAVVSLYSYAPFVGIALSVWRLIWRDYGISNSGDNSKANLTPALDMYYALVLLQGTFYLIWYFNSIVDDEIVRSVYRRYNLKAKWGKKLGKKLVSEYHLNTRRSYTKEPASLEHRNLISYAVGLLESESREEYMSGARLLTTFIEQGKDVRSVLLLSRPKIQKLIDTLGWRCIPGDDSCQGIRLLVAKIVADVAGNIHLAQFPGAAQCIASLFEEDEDELLPPLEDLPVVVTRSGRIAEGRNRSQKKGDQEGENEMSSINTEGDTYNENGLILQGLTILERLASNQHNCRDICSTPGLLSVITAPIFSNTLIQDIKVSACAQVVLYRSFKVVHQLIIGTPGWTGKKLRHKISSSDQAVSNLEKILDRDTGASKELKMVAMEILTEMALDLSINLPNKTKDNLITRQLRIFFDADEGEEDQYVPISGTVVKKKEGEEDLTAMLKVVAGRKLALLSSKSERNSLYIIRESDDNVDRLTQITFDVKTDIVYKITAAEILVNLCTHCSSMLPEEYVKGKLLPAEYVKRTLLPKVLTRILSSSSNVEAQQQGNFWNCCTGICGSASQGDDVESQPPNHNIQNQLRKPEFLEALLSLTLVIYDKMIYIDGFDAMFQGSAPADQFVARLKTIVEENCKGKATSVSLRIVKLCGQMAISMMQWQRNQYTVHFSGKNFVESLSNASRIMSNLDSCMLVTGTNNCRMRKNSRPLLSYLEKKVRELVR